MTDSAAPGFNRGLAHQANDPGYPWDALRVAKKWSDVGDYIWIRLCNGATPKQLKRDLAEYVDEMEARRAAA